MKNMKKLVSLMLTLVMAMSLTVTAFAYTVTITEGENDNADHTYEAYQIFKGDLATSATPAEPETTATTAVLSNIQWGSGITDEGKAALQTAHSADSAAELAEKLTDAAAFAKEVNPYLQNPITTTTNAFENLDAGYYLIKDKKDSLINATDGAYTSYIIEVVEDSTVTPKSAVPTVDKQVWDENGDQDTKTNDANWGETADHAMNESFQFKLIATIPANDNLADYDSYKVVFTDTMSAGITFESIASVKVGATDVPVTGYTCTATEGQKGESWTLTIADIMTYDENLVDGAVVTVIYNAHLNEAAKLDDVDENKNSVDLQYSNNPYAETELGRTQQDHVWVFTYTMNNTKVDGTNNNAPLAGAGFRLYSDEGCTAEIPVAEDKTKQVYVVQKIGTTGEEMISAAETGGFNIVGLDAGTYYLKETTTPAGYNTAPVVKVEIAASHSETANGGAGDEATTTITREKDDVAADINTIVNNKGIVLPETGGVGTTIFYIAGAVLVLGAAVLLITKRRMNTER